MQYSQDVFMRLSPCLSLLRRCLIPLIAFAFIHPASAQDPSLVKFSGEWVNEVQGVKENDKLESILIDQDGRITFLKYIETVDPESGNMDFRVLNCIPATMRHSEEKLRDTSVTRPIDDFGNVEKLTLKAYANNLICGEAVFPLVEIYKGKITCPDTSPELTLLFLSPDRAVVISQALNRGGVACYSRKK